MLSRYYGQISLANERYSKASALTRNLERDSAKAAEKAGNGFLATVIRGIRSNRIKEYQLLEKG